MRWTVRDRRWLLVAGGVLVVLAAHVALGALAIPHTGLSTAVVAAIVGVVVIAHLGVAARVVAWLRRKRPPPE
jgi:hypothetical protein